MRIALGFSQIAVFLLFICHDTNGQISFGSGNKVASVPGRPKQGGSSRPRPQSHNIGFGQPIQQQHFNQQTPRPSPSAAANGNSGCNCLLAQQCGLSNVGTRCILEDGSGRQGICCISQIIIASRIGPPQKIQAKTVSTSDRQAEIAFKNGNDIVQQIEVDARNRLKNGKFIPRGEPARAHSKFFQRSKESQVEHKIALKLALASQNIVQTQGLSTSSSQFSLPAAKIRPKSGFSCPSSNPIQCDRNAKFRTVDGSCNNLNRPLAGKSTTPFKRLLPSLYEDGILIPRLYGIDGVPLPMARDISNTVLLDIDNPNSQLTLNVMQFSQFVDHDIAHGPFRDMDGEPIQCCKDGRDVSPLPEGCFNIPIPNDDQFYIPNNQRCMNFVRSMLATPPGCILGPAEQVNDISHWADGSNIYGSHQDESDKVRNHRTGSMMTSDHNLLPVRVSNQGALDSNCDPRIQGSACYAAGDSRVNEQPGLIVMHTIWMREHNRVYQQLRQLNPHWSPDQLYEEVRRIVVAELQHVMYNEWLPIIIGPTKMRNLGIGSIHGNYRNNYDQNEDPNIANEFATSAFRFGHSMIQGIFRLVTETNRTTSLRLRDVFNSPFLFERDPTLVDKFVRGLTTQPNQNLDSFVTEELSNHLFQTPHHNFGLDLMSLNIQRGRDHAIATYSQLREDAGLKKARDFWNLADAIPQDRIRRLQAVYRNVEDIDAFVGGMVETPIGDGLLGPTFSNIVGRQFQRTQEADRFFYDRGGQPSSFSPAQLGEIRKVTNAKILCDNSERVFEMQPDAFRLPNHSNNRKVPCNSLPGMDLRHWQE